MNTPEKSYNGKKVGLFYALAAAIGLGAITVQAKFVYAAEGNAATLMLVRFLISTIVIALMMKQMRLTFSIPRNIRWPVLLLGFIWSASMIAYLSSVQTITVSLAVLILYSYPILVMLFTIISGRLSVNITSVALFILAFIGLFLMLGKDLQLVWNKGLLFAVIAACGAAYTFLSGDQVAPKLNVFTLTFWVSLIGLILILPLSYAQFSWPNSAPGMLFLLGATLCYLFAIICQFKSLSILSADKAAFIFNLEPLVSILLAIVFLSERLSLLQSSGVILLLIVLLIFSQQTNINPKPN